MATASDTGNPPMPLAPRLSVGDAIPVFSLPNTSGVSVSSTVLLETGPLIITFYRGIWCPYCRSDLMALMNATFEVQSRGGSLAAIARETAPNSHRRFEQQHRVDFPILNDATAAVARSFGIGWTDACHEPDLRSRHSGWAPLSRTRQCERQPLGGPKSLVWVNRVVWPRWRRVCSPSNSGLAPLGR